MRDSSNSHRKYNQRTGFYSRQYDSWDSFPKYPDSIYFGSAYELHIYKKLLSLPGVRVERQVKILLKPETTHYPARYWKCDFKVLDETNPARYLLVEAKGLVTREFKLMLQDLEFFNYLDWRRLLIVSAKATKVDRQLWTMETSDLLEAISLHPLLRDAIGGLEHGLAKQSRK